MTEIRIGANVTKIGANAFNGCGKLKKFMIETKKLTAGGIGANAFGGGAAKPVFECPKGKVKAYQKLFLEKGAPEKATFTEAK